MTTAGANAWWSRSLAGILEASGVKRVFLSPGARSAPLVSALTGTGFDLSAHYDERGMAFAALGWSLATDVPAICLTTSGSAVANLLPACVEAFHSRVPLLMITADRPAELRGTGANQTIFQPGIFGGFARLSIDFACPGDAVDWEEQARFARESLNLLKQGTPVHWNVPFREPLTGDDKNLPPIPRPPTDPDSKLAEGEFSLPPDFFRCATGAIVIGRLARRDQAFVDRILRLGNALSWPVFADALSGARAMPGVVRHSDAILRCGEIPPPERVLHFGGSLVSKRLGQWLAACPGGQSVHVRECGDRLDPWNQQPVLRRVSIVDFCSTWAGASCGEKTWKAMWKVLDQHCSAFFAEELDFSDTPSEPAVIRRISSYAAKLGHAMCLGNSMPVRDFDCFTSALSALPFPVFGNRGASGIDGNVATAAGLAMGLRSPLWAIFGDLTVLHDLPSLALLRNLPVTLVVLNNGGGGIFRMLPLDVPREWIETPHAWNFSGAAAQFGLAYRRIESMAELAQALEENAAGPRLWEIPGDPGENARVHERLAARCSDFATVWKG